MPFIENSRINEEEITTKEAYQFDLEDSLFRLAGSDEDKYLAIIMEDLDFRCYYKVHVENPAKVLEKWEQFVLALQEEMEKYYDNEREGDY